MTYQVYETIHRVHNASSGRSAAIYVPTPQHSLIGGTDVFLVRLQGDCGTRGEVKETCEINDAYSMVHNHMDDATHPLKSLFFV